MRSLRASGALCALLAIAAPPTRLAAQTDFYNTDASRPVRVEDATPVERHAFELQMAPLRLERERGGVYAWEVEPELAYGILPRTQVEVAFPLRVVDAGSGRRTFALAGIHLSALHNLNVETSLPALAVAAEVAIPAGGLAADRTYASVKGIATRTLRWARFHLNGQYTFGAAPGAGESAGEASRWMAGIAVDRTFPFRSTLVIADLFAEQPLGGGTDLAWTAEAGVRYQTSPQFNLDAGVGRRFAGGDEAWFFTFGMSHAFALRGLIPLR
ncbi:MAG TPA: hypothetical protein VGB92_10470 [Longimicrobium sp.]